MQQMQQTQCTATVGSVQKRGRGPCQGRDRCTTIAATVAATVATTVAATVAATVIDIDGAHGADMKVQRRMHTCSCCAQSGRAQGHAQGATVTR